jgi:hypothetical protein
LIRTDRHAFRVGGEGSTDANGLGVRKKIGRFEESRSREAETRQTPQKPAKHGVVPKIEPELEKAA